MKFNTQLKALAAATALGLSGHAMAAGTLAGTLIENQVTLGYTVNSIAQTDLTQTADFMVDNKVDMTLTDDTGTSTITPGGVATYTYTLTNTGNETQFFKLDLENQIADTSDTANITIPTVTYTGGTVSGAGTASITNGVATVEPDTSIQYTASFTFPKTHNGTEPNIVDGDTFNILATATASTDATGATPLTADVATDKNLAANLASSALIVFAEAATVDSILYDGIITAGTETTAESANFTDPDDGTDTDKFTLDVTVINDPICEPALASDSADTDYSAGNCPESVAPGTLDTTYRPKAIPGAMVQYTLKAKNSGSQDATGVNFLIDLADVADADTDTNIDLVQNSLDNVSVAFSGAGTDTDNSTDNTMDVDVDTFAVDDTIEITFTAIVE